MKKRYPPQNKYNGTLLFATEAVPRHSLSC